MNVIPLTQEIRSGMINNEMQGKPNFKAYSLGTVMGKSIANEIVKGSLLLMVPFFVKK